MNTAIATRLLWKEYRQQRNLWAALLFGATLLQLIFWYFIEEPRTGNGDFMLLPLHLSTTTMVTGFFAVCSAAISFAIEREEGTQLRLVTVSCPPALMLAIKFAVVVFGTALLFAVSAGIGVCLSSHFDEFAQELRKVPPLGWLSAAYWVVIAICGGFAIGSFFSLLFRKVLPAVICTCVVMLVGVPVLIAAWSEAAFRPGGELRLERPEAQWLMAVLVAAVGILALVDFRLTRWWMNRGFSDTPRVRSRSLFRRVRMERDGLDGSVTLEIGGADRAEFEVLTHDQARILPPPRFGLSLLYNNWGRGRSRVLKFLCWKEMAESRRLFFAMWGIGLLLAVVCGIEERLFAYEQYGSPDWMPVTIGLVILAMFVCGLMTFRGEQSQDSYRLLSEHGVTPGYVWLSKQLVWLSRLLLIPLSMLLVLLIVAGPKSLGFEFRDGMIVSSFNPLELLNALATVLTFYSATQMASLTWRRAALSIFFALLCCVLLGIWLGVTSSFDVPVFMSMLPLAPALLLMTRLRTRGWLIGDDRFKRWLLPGTVGFLGIVACWFTTATWRIFEIPTAQPIVATKTLDDGSTVETVNGLTEDERAAVLAPVTDEESTTVALYRESQLLDREETLIRIVNGLRKIDEHAVSDPAILENSPPELQAEMELALNDVFEAVELVRHAASRESWAVSSPGMETVFYEGSSDGGIPYYQVFLLHSVARRHMKSSQAEKALELLRDALAVTRHIAGRGSKLEYNKWRVATDSTLALLIEWSKSEGVTPELVDEAMKVVQEHVAKSPNPFAVSLAHHQIIRNTLDLPSDEFLTLQVRSSDHYNSDDYFWDYVTLKSPGNVWRISRLVDWYETRSAGLIAEAKQFEAHGIQGAQTLGTWYRSQLSESTSHYGGRGVAEHKRWLQTTSIPGHILDDVGLSIVFVDTNAKVRSRGTQVAMNLHQARRESGEFPATLDELGLPIDVVADPWSGNPMQWFPEGLPNAIETTGKQIPAHTPLLFCGAASGAWLEETEVMVAVEEPIDPPAQVIPLQENGQAAAGADTDPPELVGGLGQDNPTTPQGQAGGASLGGAGQLGSGFDEGGMGSGMARSNVRWEAQRQFVLRRPDSSQSLQLTPIFWLISTETPEDETADDAN